MTSIKPFNFQVAIREAKPFLTPDLTPRQARKLLAACQDAYAKDVAAYGEAAVKASGFYPELVSVQGELERAAAGAVRRASRDGML
jgi:hypothetical protein